MKKQRIANLLLEARKLDKRLESLVADKNTHPQFSDEWNKVRSEEHTVRRQLKTIEGKIQNLEANLPEHGKGRHVETQTLPRRQ